MTTLRNMGYSKPREDKTRWGVRGQTSTQIVVMSDPPRSWLYIPLGQSDRPESPHFSDQAEKAFSPRRLKPTWWLPEDLAGHVESAPVLLSRRGRCRRSNVAPHRRHDSRLTAYSPSWVAPAGRCWRPGWRGPQQQR